MKLPIEWLENSTKHVIQNHPQFWIGTKEQGMN